MNFNWRKWNRVIHRDFGYFFFGMTIIYCLSGIAINHMRDWNPNYVIITKEIQVEPSENIDKTFIKNILAENEIENDYLNHYFPSKSNLKVFLKDGTLYVDLETGKGLFENIKRRMFFKPMNYLHYNPIKYWTWYSDIFSGALILIAITGLFIVRGPKGITRRGAWMTILGILIPVVYLLIFYF
ncbi:MAG: PepSY-associated TM helix domain-containing protein [Bacteroidetes bacterium]|nr:PepSY-associated TM helix domain-containing protein [Bacteroidota bacterium]